MSVKFIANLNTMEFRAYCHAYSTNGWECAGPAHPNEFAAWLEHYVDHRNNADCPGQHHVCVRGSKVEHDVYSVVLPEHTAQVICRTLRLPIPEGVEIKAENAASIHERIIDARTMSRKLCPTLLVQIRTDDSNVMLQTPLDAIDALCSLADRSGGKISWHQEP
jgi:hypothetical protein